MSKNRFYLSENSLARIAEKRAARANAPKESVAKPVPIQRSRNAGVVYIIGAANGKSPYKIGFSKNPDLRKRLCSIQVSNWVELCIIYKSPIVDNVTQLERRIHGRYSDKRIRNEWFLLTRKDIKQIQHEIETDDYSDEKLMQELLLKQTIISMRELDNKRYFRSRL